MSRFHFRDDDDSSVGTVVGVLAGVLAGLAVGMFIAHRAGGIGALTARIRRRVRPDEYASRHAHEMAGADEFEDYESDELEEPEDEETLEEHVLEAFRNDPLLAERAVDIGALRPGVIELSGWVDSEAEARHAVTVARGVPGVETVVNRISVGDEEERLAEAAQRVSDGDPSLTGAQWESNIVGTGRRRQGTSAEMDRHADPKVSLEERWTREDVDVNNAAEDMEGIAERRRSSKKVPRGDRTGGSPISPSGVPKGDHVANPPQADRQQSRADAADDVGGERSSKEHY